MLVIGEIKCLHCGFENGRWVGARGAPITAGGLRGRAGAPDEDPAALVRCGRCEGPVFLDNADMVINSARLRRIRRMREQLAALEARRAA